jgi:hypothetical protein
MTKQLPRHRVVIAVLALFLAAAGFAWTAFESNRQGEQIDALAAALEEEQQAAEERGLTPVAPAPEELIEDPEAELPEPLGPTDGQVYEAVQAYFREHPVEDGEDASPAEIAAAVINYLTENPPEPGTPGPAPTADQIMSAVSSYLTANPPPPGSAGKDGQDGEDGHTPTSAEIQAELEAYFAANPIEMCDPGATAQALTVLTVGAPTDIVACVVNQEEN